MVCVPLMTLLLANRGFNTCCVYNQICEHHRVDCRLLDNGFHKKDIILLVSDIFNRRIISKVILSCRQTCFEDLTGNEVNLKIYSYEYTCVLGERYSSWFYKSLCFLASNASLY